MGPRTVHHTIDLNCGISPPAHSNQQDGLQRSLRVRSKRNLHFHCGPAPWFAVELKCPVQLEHALSHIDQPQASRFSDLVGGATNAIIGDGKPNETVGPA